MHITLKTDGVIDSYRHQLRQLGNQAPLALQRALNHSGDKARTQVVRTVTKESGLRRDVIARAVKVTRPTRGQLVYVLDARGGDIRVKFFKPRETRKGVSAAPWGKRQVFDGAFMKAGWVWGRRIDKPNWNGQVFRRTGRITKNGMDQFEVVRSGVTIPGAMVMGTTEKAWRAVVDRDLADRIGHEIKRLLPR